MNISDARIGEEALYLLGVFAYCGRIIMSLRRRSPSTGLLRTLLGFKIVWTAMCVIPGVSIAANGQVIIGLLMLVVAAVCIVADHIVQKRKVQFHQ